MKTQSQPKSQYYSEVAHLFNADLVKRAEPFIMTQYHYHNVHEIHYFFDGERRLFYKDRIYHIIPGDLVIIKKYELHSLCDWDKPGHTRILIDFKNEFFDSIKSDINLLKCFERDIIVMRPTTDDKKILGNKMMDIVNEFSEKRAGYITMVTVQMADLLITLDRMMENYSDEREMPSQQYIIVSEIMTYIAEHCSEKLSLEILGKEFGYSRNYLCGLFKSISGFSIVSYINGIRIKKSQEMLKNTRMSVARIAQDCGFESSTHFGRVFKEIAGCSPMRYRIITSK